MTAWDWFVHGANVLYLISYLVKDVFLLRLVLMIAMIVFLPFYIFSGPEPMWTVLAWQAVFLSVNGVQLYRLFIERRPVVLDTEDDDIYRMSFSAFTIKQFAKLLTFGKKETLAPNEVLFDVGSQVNRVIFITQGGAEIQKDGENILNLQKGDLVADVNYITESPVQYKIVTNEESKILSWDKNEFEKAVAADPNINSSWQSLISARLAQKLSTK